MGDYNLEDVQPKIWAVATAMAQLTEALQDTGYDCSPDYPFANSFDEVTFEVSDWAWTHQRLFDQKLKGLNQ